MNTTLDESNVNFEQLLNAFPTPYLVFLVKWPELIIVACSDTYLEVTKASRAYITGKTVFEAFPPLPGEEGENTKNDFLSSFERVMQNKMPDVMGVQRYDVPKKDNPYEFTEKYWTVTNSPVLNDKGDVQYIIQRVEDITEYVLLKRSLLDKDSHENGTSWSKVEAEIMRASHEVKASNRDIKGANEELERNKQQLITLNNNLKELDKLKTDFFSNISHEFRTPLTLMLAPLEELLTKNNFEESIYSKIDIAHRNATRLLKLVNNLLDFSKLEAGKTKAVFRPWDITKLTKELASHFDSAAKRSDIQYIIQCPNMPEFIYLDADAYEKILLNLISNAFKHTFKGSIEVSLSWEEEGVELKVRDTGIGIPTEQLEYIFERFHRVPNAKARTHEGSGIGLSLAKELVKLHHGTIHVSSVLQQGSVFTVFLPKGKSHLPCEQIELNSDEFKIQNQSFIKEVIEWIDQPKTKTSEQFTSDRKRILLADDNPDMRNYIKQLLVSHYEVTVVTNGKEALETAKICKPDLILSDVMMPIMTGIELVNAIRQDPQLKLIPVILLSARAGDDAKIHGLETGADDYLIKPFSAPELLTRIKTNLSMQQSRLEAQWQIERTAKLKDQFISNISHELRTPLNAIIGYSEMILKGMVDCEKTKLTFTDNIKKAGRHLLLLINDILDMSKIEAGKFTLNLKWINLNDFMTDLHSMLRELASSKKVVLNFNICNALKEIKADEIRLKQIMINLLNNAIKFNRENGKVDVSLQIIDNKFVYWKITDTGIGIPQDKLKELFTEFYQVDNSSSRSYEGTGLGLALTKKLINLHGGDIWVESEKNEGSTFTFTLPFEHQEQSLF